MDKKDRIKKLETLGKLCRVVSYCNLLGAVLNAYAGDPMFAASFAIATVLWLVGGLCNKQAKELKDEQ